MSIEFLAKAANNLAPEKCFSFEQEPTNETEFLNYFNFESARDEEGNVEFSNNSDIFPFTWAELSAKADELQADYDAKEYQRDRADAYPSIQEQLDMQYHDAVNGTTTWKDAIAQVKTDNPKPSE